MKNNKKFVLVGGSLLSPLEIGACIIIRAFNDELILTNPVQAILQDNCIFAKFETLDSIYYVFQYQLRYQSRIEAIILSQKLSLYHLLL